MEQSSHVVVVVNHWGLPGSKVGRDVDISSNYASQLSELSSPTILVPPMLVDALVQRYRHLSSHKKMRQSQPLLTNGKATTMREHISKLSMSPPPRDHVGGSSSRAVGKDFPWKDLPPPRRNPMHGPPFVQNRYPNNKDSSSSRDYSRSSP